MKPVLAMDFPEPTLIFLNKSLRTEQDPGLKGKVFLM